MPRRFSTVFPAVSAPFSRKRSSHGPRFRRPRLFLRRLPCIHHRFGPPCPPENRSVAALRFRTGGVRPATGPSCSNAQFHLDLLLVNLLIQKSRHLKSLSPASHGAHGRKPQTQEGRQHGWRKTGRTSANLTEAADDTAVPGRDPQSCQTGDSGRHSMHFDRFMVISWNEADGLFVDHFPDREKARRFARQVADEGFRAQVTEQRDFYEARIEDDDDHGGVRPGVDFPATLERWAIRLPGRPVPAVHSRGPVLL